MLATMPPITETATLTSKGQITLPKAVRQALGVDMGSRLLFEIRGDEVVVSRADIGDTHRDPAIGAFLAMLEHDIASGRNIAAPPDELAQAMQRAAVTAVPTDSDEIDGDVAL